MSYDTVVAADSPTHWWKLGDASGTSYADNGVGSNTPLTSFGTITLGQPGIPGSTAQAALFAAGSGSTQSGAVYSAEFGALTTECWFKTIVAGSGQPSGPAIYTLAQFVAFGMDANGMDYQTGLVNGTINAYATPDSFASPSTYDDGNWHHLVLTMSSAGGNNAVLYMDGAQVATGPLAWYPFSNVWTVGGSTYHGITQFAGTLAHVAVYEGVALTPAQISAHYIAGNTGVPPVTYASTVLTDFPVFYWHLDELTGTTAADASGNGNIGTYSSGVTLGEPPAITGGTSMYVVPPNGVSVPDFPAADTYPYSIEMWVNVAYVGQWGTIFGKVTNSGWGDGFACYSTGNPNWKFWVGNYTSPGVTFPMPDASGTFTHLVVTYDGTTGTIYLNGVLAIFAPISPGASNVAPFWVGEDGNGFGLNAYFDEVAFYDHILSPASIATHYSVGAAITGGSPTSFVTSITPGTLRLADWSGYAGFQFTTGAAPITVTALGRWVVSQNTSTHQIVLCQGNTTSSSSGPVASVTVNTVGAAPNAYLYGQLSVPVTLAPNTDYCLASVETLGIDDWYDSDTTVATSSVAQVNGAIYGAPGGFSFAVGAAAGHSYVPLSFLYEGTGSATTVPGSGSFSGAFTASATGTIIFPSTGAMAGSFLTSATGTWVTVAHGSGSVLSTFAANATGAVVFSVPGGLTGIFAATATGTSRLPGAGTATGAFAASGTGLVTVQGAGALAGTFTASAAITGSGSLLGAFAATSTGLVVVPSHATLTGAFAGSAAGALAGFGQASGSFTALAQGISIDPATGTYVGTFTGLATGAVTPVALGTGAISGIFVSSAQGLVTAKGSGSVVGAFTASAAGTLAGAGTALIFFNATATSLVTVSGSGTAAGVFLAQGTASIPGLALGTGAIVGTFSASGTALVKIPSVAGLAGTFAGNAASALIGPLAATGLLATTFIGSATGTSALPGSSAVVSTFTASATGALNKVSSASLTGSFTAMATGAASSSSSSLLVGSFMAIAAGAVNQLGSGAVLGAFLGMAAGRVAENPPMSTLVDDFDSGVIDTTVWLIMDPALTNIVDGQLDLTTGGVYEYGGLQSTGSYDLTESAIFTQLVSAGDQSDTSALDVVPVYVIGSDGNGYGFEVFNGQILIDDPTLGGAMFDYDPDVHKWFRISESDGSHSYDYSTDGMTWTSFASTPDVADMTSCSVESVYHSLVSRAISLPRQPSSSTMSTSSLLLSSKVAPMLSVFSLLMPWVLLAPSLLLHGCTSIRRRRTAIATRYWVTPPRPCLSMSVTAMPMPCLFPVPLSPDRTPRAVVEGHGWVAHCRLCRPLGLWPGALLPGLPGLLRLLVRRQ